MPPEPCDISIIIVNFNVKYFVEQCLRSVFAASAGLAIEVFVVDNGSADDSIAYLTPRFPPVKFIDNRQNLGFGKANNIALRQSTGRYKLILNPDTLIGEDSLRALVGYMDSHPKVGAAGPKILTRNGEFDRTSKRGLPTPWVAFCRLSGLARLFPKSRLFGRYDLLYLDPDQPAIVDSLAGSCMMLRREAYDRTQGFDEDFFMYGEDIDLCYRVSEAGWEVHYAPVTQIVHFRGESTRRSDFNRDKAFYGAMHLFVDKHFRQKYPFIGHRLIDFGIILARLAAKVSKVGWQFLWGATDTTAFWLVLMLGRYLRWHELWLTWTVGLVNLLHAVIWVACIALFGSYSHRRGSNQSLLIGVGLGFLINSSITYFFKQFAYSRFVVLVGAILGGLIVWGWRFLIRYLTRTTLWRRLYQRRTLLVGTGDAARKVVRMLADHTDLPYRLIGIVDPEERSVGSFIEQLPVLGGEQELPLITRQEEVEEILFAYDVMDYNHVLNVIGGIGEQGGVNFKVIPPETADHPDKLSPLLSVEFLSPRGFGRSLRKIATLVIKQ